MIRPSLSRLRSRATKGGGERGGLRRRVALFPLLVSGLLVSGLRGAATVAAQGAPPPAVPPDSTPTTVPAPTAPPTVAPVDLENDFAVSVPKGLSGRICFAAKVRGAERLLVLDLDGRRVTELGRSGGNNTSPAWAPDGESVVFVSDRDGNKELYTIRWDGTGETRLTTTPEVNEDQPAWHPGGGEIAYVAENGKGGGSSNIFSLVIGTGVVKQITKLEGRNINPAWSPKGDILAYATNRFWPGWRIAFVPVKGGAEDFVSKVQGQILSHPVFSSDSERLYFANNTSGGASIGAFTLSTKSLGWGRYGPGRHIDPEPSPDGEWVGFAYAEPDATTYNFFLLNRKDRTFKPLLTSLFSLRHPTWSAVKGIALEAGKVKAAEAEAEAETPAPRSAGP